MEFSQIQELIKLINKSNLTEFKMKDGEFQISIRTKKYGKQRAVTMQPQQMVPAQMPQMQVQPVSPAGAPTPKEQPVNPDLKNTDKGGGKAADDSQYVTARSPIVGTFYRSPAPDKPPYVKVGDRIEVGQVICIVEAMKLFNEIESEVSGRIVEVVIDDASPVEYDQVLYLVDPHG